MFTVDAKDAKMSLQVSWRISVGSRWNGSKFDRICGPVLIVAMADVLKKEFVNSLDVLKAVC
jgi:hypothetical protein